MYIDLSFIVGFFLSKVIFLLRSTPEKEIEHLTIYWRLSILFCCHTYWSDKLFVSATPGICDLLEYDWKAKARTSFQYVCLLYSPLLLFSLFYSDVGLLEYSVKTACVICFLWNSYSPLFFFSSPPIFKNKCYSQQWQT